VVFFFFSFCGFAVTTTMEPTLLAQASVQSVCCVGAGYVGGPSMAVFAKNCPNLQIVVADTNRRRIDAWNSNMYVNLPTRGDFIFSKFSQASPAAVFPSLTLFIGGK
jgi:hypothetical protein